MSQRTSYFSLAPSAARRVLCDPHLSSSKRKDMFIRCSTRFRSLDVIRRRERHASAGLGTAQAHGQGEVDRDDFVSRNSLVATWSTPSTMDATPIFRQRIAPTSNQPASSDKDDASAELSYGAYPPFQPPRYSMKDLLGAVPAHCYERSAARSLYYVARDAAMIAGLAFAASWVEAAFGARGLVRESEVLRWGCWSMYWMVQGVVFLGVLILGELKVELLFASFAGADLGLISLRPRV